MKKEDEGFLILLTKFLSGLHDCHSCHFAKVRMYYNGKQTHVCDKYHAPLKNIRWHCIDRFPGFALEEMDDIIRQKKAGTLSYEGIGV
jgi:hypothetical protein